MEITCKRHEAVADYDRYKAWCDDYFFLKHRNEAARRRRHFLRLAASAAEKAAGMRTSPLCRMSAAPSASSIRRSSSANFNKPWTE